MELIMPNRLDRGFYLYQAEFEQKAIEVLRTGWYVLGKEVAAFEEEFAGYLGSKYCVGLASGLDALWIAFRALGIGEGDEVIVQGNTYIASVMGITINGATPVFVEPSHGACFEGKMTGTFGDIGCFSFYPSKNLGAFGDAGAIVTNCAELAEYIRTFRNYGSEKRYYNKVVGANSRLDEIQAGLLRVRLKHMKELEEEKRFICKKYLAELDNPHIVLPQVREGATHIWHQFVIKSDRRDELIAYLREKGVGTIIHYPIPPHLSEAYQYLNMGKGSLPITEKYADTVCSIPLYNGMQREEQDYVIDCINRFT